MKNCRRSASEQRVSAKDKPIPERRSAVRHRFSQRGPPREVGEREIGEDVVLNSRDSFPRGDPLPGILEIVEIGRPVETAREDRPAREKQGQQRERPGGTAGESEKAPGEKQDKSHRRRVGRAERERIYSQK